MKIKLPTKVQSSNFKTMKSNDRFLEIIQEREFKEKKPIDYSQGITERLLKKYKPRKGLSAIDGRRKDIQKELAA